MILRKWYKQLFVEDYEATIKYLYGLVNFCEHMETTKEIYTTIRVKLHTQT